MAKAAQATSAKGKGEEAKGKGKEVAIITLNKNAISKDVGLEVIKGLDASFRDEAKAQELLQSVKQGRYDLLAKTTAAIAKAARADSKIDLSVTFSGDVKQMASLNDMLGLALGIKEYITVGKGDAAKQKIVYSKEVAKFFPQKDDDQKDPETKRKGTLRTNFLHMLKKCAQAACQIVENDIDVKMDKKEGTLLLTGKAIKEQYGTESVLLNEKQTVKGVKKNGKDVGDIVLKEKPSFTGIAAAAAVAHGKAPQVGRRGVGGAAQGLQHDPNAALEAVAKSFVAIVEKLDPNKLSERQKKAIESVQSAADKILP